MSDKKTETPPVDEGAKVIADMSPEDLELAKNRFMFKQGFTTEDPDAKKPEVKPVATPPPVADEGKPKEAPKGDEAKPGDEKAKPAPKPRAQKPRVGLTSDEVQSAVQAGALAAIEASKPAPVETQVPVEAALSTTEKHTLDALRLMESQDPKFKGVADDTIKFWDKESKYIEAWETANPGKKFNDTEDEHSEWYDRHQPPVDADAFERAKTEVLTAPARKSAEEATKIAQEAKAETRKLQFEQRFDRAVPEMEQVIESGLLDVVEKSNPELAKLLGESGKRRWNEDSLRKLEEEDPVAFDVIQTEAERTRQLLADFECLTRFPGDIPFDPSRAVELADGSEFYSHRELVKLINELESDLATLPREDTDRDGRRFISQPQLVEREARILNDSKLTPVQKKSAVRDMRAGFWTLSQDEIRAGIVAESARTITTKLERTQALFNRKAAKPKPGDGKPTLEPKKEIESEKPAATQRMSAPAVTASSDKLNNNGTGGAAGQSMGEMAVSKMFG